MTAQRRAEALRLDTPRLEPDDAFVERLSALAHGSRPSVAARRPLQGLRVGLATAGVVGLTVGGAWAAGNLVEREDQAPGRTPPIDESGGPISPETRTTAPGPPGTSDPGQHLRPDRGRPDKGRPDKGRPDRPGERGHDRGRHVGRPEEHPGQGPKAGRGRDERGRPSNLPEPGQNGKKHRAERADPGGPKGSGDRRRPHSPR